MSPETPTEALRRAAARVRTPDDEGFLVDGDGYLIALTPERYRYSLPRG